MTVFKFLLHVLPTLLKMKPHQKTQFKLMPSSNQNWVAPQTLKCPKIEGGFASTREQPQCFECQRWLNDEVIKLYLHLIVKNNRLSINLCSIYAFGTHIYTKLLAKGLSGVVNWTKNIDLFSQDYIMIPIHWGYVNWCVAVVDVKAICISYYDSMHGKPIVVLDNLCGYLQKDFET